MVVAPDGNSAHNALIGKLGLGDSVAKMAFKR